MPYSQFDVQKIRKHFPALQQTVHGKPLIYLDNAATTQKPRAVLDALIHYYEHDNANVHRGVHTLAERATTSLEATRKCVQEFIHAAEQEEIIFTSGATAGINLVANTYGQAHIHAGDEIIISHIEHHANIVPWQMLCQARGATLKVIPVNDTGQLMLSDFDALLTPKTKLVAIGQVSNTLGNIHPVKEIIQKAHAQGAIVVVDAAQAIAHLPIDVQALDCDFLVFSAHKIYGPTGVGILYGKKALLEHMPPYQGGGEMIQEVTLTDTTYNELPYKFEAGTPNIAGIVALKAAISFIKEIGYARIRTHEDKLLAYIHASLGQVPKVQLFGSPADSTCIAAFAIEGLHHLDVGMLLDAHGIAVRTGHSCTQPLMDRLGISGIVRASMAIYNTEEEIKQLAEVVETMARKKN